MFSFIKWLGNFMEDMKRNKGLWFTILTVVSLAGIFISMYFVSFLVNDVAKKTYENQKTHYVRNMKNTINVHQDNVLAIASLMSKNEEIKKYFFSNDINKSKKIMDIAIVGKNEINKNLGSEYLNITFKAENIIHTSELVNGLNVEKTSVFFTSKIPVVEDNTTRLNVVARQNIEALTSYYHKENKEFVFVLNEGSINGIEPGVRKKEFSKFQEDYYIQNALFEKVFVDSIKKIDLPELIHMGYLKDANYFYVIDKAYDYSGDEIGYVIVAEKIDEENSFVNLIKNLVNSVTIVALGLIVSMILFLF